MTAEEQECIHGLGPVSACVLCNGRAAAEAKTVRVDEAPVTIVARHAGSCPECDLPIYPGQSVAWFPEHTRPTVHAACLTQDGGS